MDFISFLFVFFRLSWFQAKGHKGKCIIKPSFLIITVCMSVQAELVRKKSVEELDISQTSCQLL